MCWTGRRLEQGHKPGEVAKQLGVTRQTIYSVCRPAPPRAAGHQHGRRAARKLTRGALRWALTAIVSQHMTVARPVHR